MKKKISFGESQFLSKKEKEGKDGTP